MNNLAVVYADTQELEKATKLYYEALKIRKEFAQSNPQVFCPKVAMMLNNLALLYLNANELKKAMPLIEEAISIRQPLFATAPAVFRRL